MNHRPTFGTWEPTSPIAESLHPSFLPAQSILKSTACLARRNRSRRPRGTSQASGGVAVVGVAVIVAAASNLASGNF